MEVKSEDSHKKTLWIVAAISIVLFFNCFALHAKEWDIAYEVSDVMAALLEEAPARPLYRNLGKRIEFARDIVVASNKHKVPELLLTVKVYNESSFRQDAESRDGYHTRGLGQMHGAATKGCNLKTRRGQLQCSARWLRVCHDKCKTWRGALIAYGTSGHCKAKKARFTKKYAYAVDRQIKKWMEFEEQREHIRAEIIDDEEHYASIRELD